MHRVLLVAVALSFLGLIYGCRTSQSRKVAIPPASPQVASAVHEGQPAPDIDGEDMTGQPLHLADYKGNVVVLVFWAKWCKHCMESIPSEQALAAKMEGRPFTILGVNCDQERETLQQVSFTQHISWPNWWNGGVHGPYTKSYGVDCWPTVVVLDSRGVVRQIHHGKPGPDLEQNVERLVREAEKGKKG